MAGRERTVFDRDTVARLWANQSQGHARDAGDRMSFRGTKFYSYATVIGEIVETSPEGGSKVYLYTNDSYSSTTSKHQSHLRHAIRWSTSFEVPGCSWGSADLGDKDRIMRAWAKQIGYRLEEAFEHPRRGKRLFEEAREIRGKMERFQKLFNLSYRIPVIPDTPVKLVEFKHLAIAANVRDILDRSVGRLEMAS